MKVFFEATAVPCVDSPEIRWHVDHGWVWDVIEIETRRRIGVFFCTLLCGDGCIVHFSSVPGEKIPWPVTLAAFRKGMKMVANTGMGVIYATIPAEKRKLVGAAILLGFGITDGGFVRKGTGEIVLLKYFGRRVGILRNRSTGGAE